MDLVRAQDKSRLRREREKEAVALALDGRWEEAIMVNREILRLFPEDVEAHNRLGKALMELGRYAEARDAFQKALALSPHNSIARKNLERLAHLQGQTTPSPKRSRKVTPHLFIEESGRSGVAELHNTAPDYILAKMAAGDLVNLKVEGHALVVENLQGEYLGEVEPPLAFRLIRLMEGGNRYQAAILSINEASRDDQRPRIVRIIIREVYRHPSQAGISSFPSRPADKYRDHLTPLPYELEAEEAEEEEVEETVPTWRDEVEEPLAYLEEASEELAPQGEEETEEQ